MNDDRAVDEVAIQLLSCEEVEALLPLVVDGAIDVAGDQPLFDHLARCERCQASLATYDLAELVLDTGVRPPARVVVRRMPWPVAAAAALLIAASAALAAWNFGGAIEVPGDQAPPPVAERDDRVLKVIEPGPGRRAEIYIVRDGDEVRVFDRRQLDGGRLVPGGPGDSGTPVFKSPEDVAEGHRLEK